MRSPLVVLGELCVPLNSEDVKEWFGVEEQWRLGFEPTGNGNRTVSQQGNNLLRRSRIARMRTDQLTVQKAQRAYPRFELILDGHEVTLARQGLASMTWLGSSKATRWANLHAGSAVAG